MTYFVPITTQSNHLQLSKAAWISVGSYPLLNLSLIYVSYNKLSIFIAVKVQTSGEVKRRTKGVCTSWAVPCSTSLLYMSRCRIIDCTSSSCFTRDCLSNSSSCLVLCSSWSCAVDSCSLWTELSVFSCSSERSLSAARSCWFCF